MSPIFSWRGRTASANSFQRYLKAHAALKILQLCTRRCAKRTQRQSPEDSGGGPGQEERAGGRREKRKYEQMKPPAGVRGGQREDVKQQQVSVWLFSPADRQSDERLGTG